MLKYDAITTFKEVPFLQGVDEANLLDLADVAKLRSFAPGQNLVSELELGADVFIIESGEAEVTVTPRQGRKQIIGRLGRGANVGEMASITGELRSASVTAIAPVRAWVIPDKEFDDLRARCPEIAVHCVRTLAMRMGEADRTLEQLLIRSEAGSPERADSMRLRSWRALWNDWVVSRQKELPFLILASFVLALLQVRALVFLSFLYQWAPFGVLRAAYTSGYGLLLGSAGTFLFTYRRAWRRRAAIAFGVGLALVLNQLGVTLAFDIFYKDIHTPDPDFPLDVELLYRRTEPVRAIVIGLVILIQSVYLRRFYGRLFFRLRIALAKRLGWR